MNAAKNSSCGQLIDFAMSRDWHQQLADAELVMLRTVSD